MFLLWANEGRPYLARTALLRRRLRRLLTQRDRLSRVLSLTGVVERVEYWPTGSQLESSLLYLELAQKHFPDDWARITRLKPPAFVRLTLDNPFPRTMITTRLPHSSGTSRGLYFGPFPSRAAAERFDQEMLDLFQLRRCEENLAPSPEHPGCIYGEMNRCLRPCQQAVSIEEYRGEAGRVEQFLRTGGASLKESAIQARDRASEQMQFEEAERLHQRVVRIAEVQTAAGELGHALDTLAGVAIAPSATPEAVNLFFLVGGCWQEPLSLSVTEIAGVGLSLDHRLRDLVSTLAPKGDPNPEHLAILTRWHGSSWRDGEWIPLEWPRRELQSQELEKVKVPYRKIVNAIARVSRPIAKVD